MISNSINIFVEELSQMEQHLIRLKSIDRLRNDIHNSEWDEPQKEQVCNVLTKNTNEKIFDYNANIISLYGYWEKFVESIIREYLEILKSYKTENDYKNKAVSKNYKDSLLYILVNKRKNFKLKDLNENEVIEALYKGIVLQKNDYIAEAFFQSGGNYNYAEIKDCFVRLGFKNFGNELQLYSSIFSYYQSNKMTLAQVKSTTPDLLFKKLDNLVVCRNEIAHGASDGSNLLDSDELLEYIHFMESLGNAINEYLNDDLYSIYYKINKGYTTKVKHYFAKNNASEMVNSDYLLDTKRIAICFKGESTYPHFSKLKIKSLWVDGTPYPEQYYLSLHDCIEKVTIVFDQTMKKGYEVKFLE